MRLFLIHRLLSANNINSLEVKCLSAQMQADEKVQQTFKSSQTQKK